MKYSKMNFFLFIVAACILLVGVILKIMSIPLSSLFIVTGLLSGSILSIVIATKERNRMSRLKKENMELPKKRNNKKNNS